MEYPRSSTRTLLRFGRDVSYSDNLITVYPIMMRCQVALSTQLLVYFQGWVLRKRRRPWPQKKGFYFRLKRNYISLDARSESHEKKARKEGEKCHEKKSCDILV